MRVTILAPILVLAYTAAMVVGQGIPGVVYPSNHPTHVFAAETTPESEALVALREAEYYQRNGDYQTALTRYRDAIGFSADSPAGKDAFLGLAQLQHQIKRYPAAVDTLRDFLGRFPDDWRAPTATYMLGVNLRAGGSLPEAVDYFRGYASMGGVLSGYAHYQLGEMYLTLDQPSAAVEHLTRALDYDLPRAVATDAMDKLAGVLTRTGNHSAAEAWRERQISWADTSSGRAQAITRLAEARSAQGQATEARNLLLEVIQDYSWTPAAVHAVESVAVEGGGVDDLQRGLVDFRNDRHDEAIKAFDMFLTSKPGAPDAATALYYKGLSQKYSGDIVAAAWTLWEMLVLDSGTTLEGEALWQLGLLSEAAGQYAQAMEWYHRSAVEYPKGDVATDALFRQGLNYYRLDDLTSAQAVWEEVSKTYPSSQSPPRVQFWLGKLLLELGQTQPAAEYLLSAAESQSRDYYGVRAREYYEARIRPSGERYLLDVTKLNAEIRDEQMEFETWLAAWSGGPRLIFDGSYAVLSGDESFARLQELIRAGLHGEARDEIDDLRQRYRGDPSALYELLMFLRRNEYYRLSILTANDIVRLSPAASLQGIPHFLQKMAYPVPFAELILADGQKFGVDPLLLTAIIRQESMFDRQAESPANAKGLGQVMPATGNAIARSMQMASFDADELFKPYVNVAFGAFFFGSHLRSFEGNLFFALAAYNAGPSNVEKWLAGNPRQDLDLFVEDIRFSETQSYVRRVYFFYDMYRQIWAQKSW